MDTDKIHKRVLEIQSQIQNVSPQKQTEMLEELMSLVSKVEQSLSEMKIDIDEPQNDIENE